MNRPFSFAMPFAVLAWLLGVAWARPETFRVATYNLEGYLDEPTQTRPAKPPQAKAKIRESLCALKPDLVALQEVGRLSALQELQASLKAEGLDLPHWEYVPGHDTNIHVAILSRFAFIARRPHTNESFLLSGRRHWVSRGFGEVDVRVTPAYSFTLLTAHLKSRRPVPEADEAELRLEEAKLLRSYIDARLKADPRADLIVLGDFNDNKDAASTRLLLGRGKLKLVDTCPAERNSHAFPGSAATTRESRRITWTHYYAKEDSFSRIDFLLLSPEMAKKWVPAETYLLASPDWGVGSDHRPLVATFEVRDD